MESAIIDIQTSSEGANVTTPANPAPTPTSPLLALPREIRDAIYSLCFLLGDYPFKALDDYFKIRLGHTGQNSRQRLPVWILASKQVLDEAMQQFYRDAAYTYVKEAHYSGREGGLLKLHPRQNLRIMFKLCIGMPAGRDGEDYTVKMSIIEMRHFNPKVTLLPQLQAYGFKELNVAIWFDQLIYSSMTTRFRDDRIPDVSDYLVKFASMEEPLDRIEFVVEELCTDFKDQGDQNLASYEVVYSLFQERLLDLGVNIVAPAGTPERGYAVRDWVESESHIFYHKDDFWHFDPQQGTRRHWHLEVTCAAPRTTGKIVHWGQSTFRDARNQSTYFENRKENEDGSVEWTAPGLGTKHVQVPPWLKDLPNRGVSYYKEDLVRYTTMQKGEDL